MFAKLFSWLKPSKERRLIRAAIDGQLQEVQQLLDEGADPNTNLYDYPPLNWSAWTGNVEMVRMLLAAGANIEGRNKKGSTPLILAAMKGRTTVLRELIQAGADLHAKTNSTNDNTYGGVTALMAAALQGYDTAVEILLEAGADPDDTTDEGLDAEGLAFSRGHIQLADKLAAAAARKEPAANRNIIQLEAIAKELEGIDALDDTGRESILLLQQLAKTTVVAMQKLTRVADQSSELKLMEEVVDAVDQEQGTPATQQAVSLARRLIQTARAGVGN